MILGVMEILSPEVKSILIFSFVTKIYFWQKFIYWRIGGRDTAFYHLSLLATKARLFPGFGDMKFFYTVNIYIKTTQKLAISR